MVMKISGIDIVPYIKYQGLKWQRSDVDGPNAGRNQMGDTIRDRKAIKIRWDVECRLLTAAEQSMILKLIEPEFVTVTYTDPVTNTVKTAQFYSNNIPTSYHMEKRNGTELWSGLTFPLVMK